MRVVLRRALRRQGDGARRDHAATTCEVTAMHPEQRCTIASVAGHAMYERSNPYYEFVAGGTLDMTDCHYEQFDERTTRITGPRFVAGRSCGSSSRARARSASATSACVGIRDPYTIANVDRVIAWARDQVRERFGDDGLRAALQRLRPRRRHGRARAAARPAGARAVHRGAGRRADARRWPRRSAMIGTAPDVLRAPAGGERHRRLGRVSARRSAAREPRLSLDAQPHACAVDDPLELFPTHMIEAGAE